MKRLLVACAVAALGLLPGAGQASTTNVVTCDLTGTATWESAVTAAPTANAATIEGGLVCYKGTIDGETASGDTLSGELFGSLAGTAGCTVGTQSGEFSAIFLTGEGTRDVWSGNVGLTGGLLNVAVVALSDISHQSFDQDTQEWVENSADAVGLGGAAGTIQIQIADPSICAGEGFTSAVFDGRISGAFNVG